MRWWPRSRQHLPGARSPASPLACTRPSGCPRRWTGSRSLRAAARESVGVYPLGYAYITPRPRDDGLVLGYANLPEPAIEEGIRRLARALDSLGAE